LADVPIAAFKFRICVLAKSGPTLRVDWDYNRWQFAPGLLGKI